MKPESETSPSDLPPDSKALDSAQQPRRLEVTLGSEAAGKRIDAVAASQFSEFSRSLLSRWLKEGRLTCNGEILAAKQRLHGGETLELTVPAQTDGWHQAEIVDFDVLFEDEDLIVVNKPAGLVVHPGAGNASGTLVNGLLAHRAELSALPRAGIVHRLDKDTSGLMVVAASYRAHTQLVSALSEHRVARRYEAICEGAPPATSTIDLPIGRDSRQRTRQAVAPDGKRAVTHVSISQRYRAHSLLSVVLETGRTHQIRVHLSYQGFPLVGDARYGARRIVPVAASDALRMTIERFERQALHAAELSFVHPGSGEEVSFSQPAPADFESLREVLVQDAQQHERDTFGDDAP
ncbi:MAG: RluA family pseudouridine synthase [Pseudomonadaceae bacterium]|nr:RluA family pseudouridine synthase [Pseudomonadaceae bacterium]